MKKSIDERVSGCRDVLHQTGQSERVGKFNDDELIKHCLENHKEAWNEFFRRFMPEIKKAIKEKLFESGNFSIVNNSEVIWEIHEKIVVKLFSKGLLKQCNGPESLRPWLKSVARNQTVDWLRELNRTKNLPQQEVEGGMVSLDEILDKGKIFPIVQESLQEHNHQSDLEQDVEAAIACLGELKNEQIRWILRLSIISSLPLSEDETLQLATFNGYPAAELKKRLSAIMEVLENKELEKQQDLGRAVIIWHQLRRLERKLSQLGRCGDIDRSEIDEVQLEIQNKSKKRVRLLESARKASRPSNGDIGELVCLPNEKVDQVSSLLARARKYLREAMEKPIVNI